VISKPFFRPFLTVSILAILFLTTSFYKASTRNNHPDDVPADSTVENLFRQPPQKYGIRCWWWWLNGNVTKEVITRDLTEMKAKGFSGACIFDAGGQNQQGNGNVPEGPMFGSAQWKALYVHAVKEADRLGLILSLNIQSGWNLGGPDITPEEATKHITWSEINIAGPAKEQVLPSPASHDNFYKDIVVIAFPKKNGLPTRIPIKDLALKAAFREGNRSGFDNEKLLDDVPASPNEEDAALQQVIVLQNKLDASGKLDWQVPAGEWTIMRFGFTTSGAEVSTSSGKWNGRVIDYMNAKYFNRYWDTHVEPLLTAIGPMAGKTLRYLQTDSWELGGINWSDQFAEEFSKRRGYEVYAYLPIVAGKIIQNREVSNSFLADFRKTIGDCVADNHYKIFSERAAKYGMGIQPESAGPHSGQLDGLKNYGFSEIMMSEFWSPSPHRARIEDKYFVKQAASAAHIYNKQLVGAESFTTIGRHWNDVPWSTMKPAFDHEVCSGLNLVLLHTFTCSPKEMGLPGQEYFAGTHINPNITWWNDAGAVFDYLKRCQYLMQQTGTVVTDVLYYYGDHVPNIGHLKEHDPARVLPGYDYDLINEEKLLTLSVKDGRITLPHGVSYRVMVLPDTKVLSLAVLHKIKELVLAGATVIGAKPERLVSLTGYPQSITDFEKGADEIWGQESPVGEHAFGKGKVIWGKPVREVLADDHLAPDFEVIDKTRVKGFDYIHRVIKDMDIYFISSQSEKESAASFSFRISGKQPELWNAVTGEIRNATSFRQQNENTILPIQFDPYGSVFVVFRKKIAAAAQGKAADNSTHYQTAIEIKGPWQVAFDPKMGVPPSLNFTTLSSWTSRTEKGIADYSGKGVYTTHFDFAAPKKGARYFIVLNNVQDVGIARVKINNKDAGVTWTPPFRTEITSLLQKGNNTLEVEVTNSWRNRLVGDRDLSAEQRYTKTNITIKPEWQRLDAGLLGPVQIITVHE